MAPPSLLIAAFSGRALAASARRAGFTPLVVDCFGDEDTRGLAERLIALPARVQTGFRPRPLLDALATLAAHAPSPIAGLVLGSGFECSPSLVARLTARFRLLGCDAHAIRRTKSPQVLFGLLDRLAIAHPETRGTPPTDPDGWLMKRIGGSGGLHIVPCPAAPRTDPRRYFQRRVPGEAISMGAIAHEGGITVAGLSRQWASPLPRRPYRYGGAVTMTSPDASLAQRLTAIAEAVSHQLDLVGLVSFDFLVSDGTPSLIEINPRPGATLDILDDADGWLLSAHIAACLGGALPARSASPDPPARAAAILYADRGPLTIGSITWPAWLADRPMPGTRVETRQPLASVTAERATPAAAECLCHERVEAAADMLYGHGPGKETQQ